jgi:uncharacterized protein (TIGR02246 family)
MTSELAPDQVAADLIAALVVAWTAHDMMAFAGQFHEDAVFINVVGAYMNGRAEIEQHHAAAHTSIFANSTISMRLADVRAAAADVLVAHAHTEMRGDARAPDEVRKAILTFVIEQRDGEWKFSAAQNTTIVPRP